MIGAAVQRPHWTGRIEQTLVRVGVKEHAARLLAATPSLRASWLAAAAVTVGFSALAAQAGPGGVVMFLVVAPLVPLAGVAASYGPWMDPMHEMARATPTSGIRLLLLRSSAVLVTTAVVVSSGAAFLPGGDWFAGAWILPSLALALASLALSTMIPTQWAAAGVTLTWLVVVAVVEARSADPFSVFRGPGQAAFFLVVVGSSAVLARRREHLEIEGRAKQRRLIDAAETERRRIERNIHDGAQQQIVAISVKLGIARTLVTGDPGRAIALLADLEAEAQDALSSLREMTRGTYPPILADEGLAAAIEAKAGRSPIAVSVTADGIGRFSKEVETAVYYCCLEGLQNAAKYAHGSRASVTLRRVGGELAFTVADEGPGFDPEIVRRGVGMRSMTERMHAVGGKFELRSAPGAGTTIVGRVPLDRS